MTHRGRWCHRTVVAVAVLAVVGLFCLPAYGGEDEALDQVRTANEHYDAGDFRQALKYYRTAYDELEDERLLYRIGLSYDNLANYQMARRFLEEYLQRDPDSDVRGRVEAMLKQAQRLEESVQSYLSVESEPEGAEIYLHGYMGEPAGTTPAKVPVGAGTLEVTLEFAQGQRLQVVLEVDAGETVERFFQVGTGEPVARDGEGEEVASTELAAVETVEQPEDAPPQEQVPPDEVEEPTPDEEAEPDDADPIPTPQEDDIDTQLDYVDAGPPWWASTLGITGIALGHIWLFWGLGSGADSVPPPRGGVGGAILGGGLLIGGGFYLLGRDWQGQLPPIDAATQQEAAIPSETGRVMFQWGHSF